MTDVLLSEDRDRVRLLTFNRPERANAFNELLYHAAADALRSPADDFTQEQAVGEERQVMPVLFECGDGEHDRCVFVERLDRRPRQFRELHGVLL